MVATTIACVPIFISGRRITRLEGMVFVAAYIAYLAYLIASRV